MLGKETQTAGFGGINVSRYRIRGLQGWTWTNQNTCLDEQLLKQEDTDQAAPLPI